MKLLLVETRIFSKHVYDFLTPERLRKVQNELMDDPEKGDVIPGCAGVRKLRVENATTAKGKRGGCRIVYISIPEYSRIYFLAIYAKNVKEDMAEDEKNVLVNLVKELKIALKRNRNRRDKF